MTNGIKILHLDDDIADFELINEILSMEFNPCTITRVNNEVSFINKLTNEKYDLVLSDFALPSFDGLSALDIRNSINKEIPFVFISGHIGEERAIEALKRGAADYVLKDNLQRLNPVIKRIFKDAEDNTKRRQMEEALIQAKEKAETSSKLKDAFIANISHEIRTPLTGILGLLSVIEELYDPFKKPGDEDLFEGIYTSSQRLIRTTNMIMNYSRLHVGEFEVFPKNIDLVSICNSILYDFRLEAKKKRLNLLFDHDSGGFEVFADEYSVTEAVSNLIDNAIKFSKDGSVNIVLNNNGSEIILLIKDSGIGISNEYMADIFQPYSQEEMGYGRTFEGLGLGLSLVKKLLDLNKVRIDVESQKGIGTTFRLAFTEPKHPESQKQVHQPVPLVINKPIAKEKFSILYVEDEAINQLAVQVYFKKDYQIFTADSAKIAREILNNHNIDIILMDISIKGDVNGLQLTRELKSSPAFANIPIIIITAHSFDKDRENSFNSGAEEYISKPFRFEFLVDVMNKWLGQ